MTPDGNYFTVLGSQPIWHNNVHWNKSWKDSRLYIYSELCVGQKSVTGIADMEMLIQTT